MLVELASRYLLSALIKEVVGLSIEVVAWQALDACLRPSSERAPRPSGAVVVSATPGRVRFRVEALRGDPSRAAAMVGFLQDQPGVCEASANPVTGTVLVCYDPSQETLTGIQSKLEGRSRRERLGRTRRLLVGPSMGFRRGAITRRIHPRALIARRQAVSA
jgi:Heavy metal associated domain 2